MRSRGSGAPARAPRPAGPPDARPGAVARFVRHPSFAAAVAAFALQLPGLGAGFVWDDHWLIEQNPLLRSGAGLARALSADFWSASGASGMWRPAITLSYFLDARIGHGAPGWFHVVNALAHALVSALVAALALGAGAGGLAAGLAGLLFASMPAHLESVAWISGRTDVLCALFFLLALLLDRRARAAGRRWPGVGPLLALALALLSKETALAFLLVVAAAERVGAGGRRPPVRESALWLAPYAALSGLHLLAHAAWGGPAAEPGAVLLAHPAAFRRALALMFPGYLGFAWPWFPHTPAVTLDPLGASAWAIAGAVLVQAAFVAWLAWLLWRRAPAALPLALFYLTLLPTLLVNLVRGYTLYAERFFYLPSAGLAWAAAAGIAAVRPWRRAWAAAIGAAVVLVVAGGWATTARLPAWRDDFALFGSMVRDAPRSYMARTEFARQLALAGREADAQRELAVARRLEPLRPEEPNVRAFLASRRGDWAAALAGADQAVARGDADLEPRLVRTTALLALGRWGEGEAALDSLRRSAPGQPAVESLWGQYLLHRGRVAEALPVLERAAAMLPGDVEVRRMLELARRLRATGRR